MSEKIAYNRYELTDDGKTVVGYFPCGKKFMFDFEDMEKVTKYSWYLCGYPKKIIICNRNRTTIHRYLLDNPQYTIDHIDLDRFNNKRSNLRICYHRENQCNRGLQKNNKSGASGVRFYKPRNKYAARIKHFGEEIHLGYYEDKTSAMQARNVAMMMLFGEFALLNDVPPAPVEIEQFVTTKCMPYAKKTDQLKLAGTRKSRQQAPCEQ